MVNCCYLLLPSFLALSSCLGLGWVRVRSVSGSRPRGSGGSSDADPSFVQQPPFCPQPPLNFSVTINTYLAAYQPTVKRDTRPPVSASFSEQRTTAFCSSSPSVMATVA
ncbi:hypothetical protein F5Y08DRAFT_187393 [Xylaria arbuscula]|nr:hypothetical protein F5Y08DRAFT_187393 [Xylaria arbuscula]